MAAGFAREDLFTVVLEHFLTDTARYADILLPATMMIEHHEGAIEMARTEQADGQRGPGEVPDLQHDGEAGHRAESVVDDLPQAALAAHEQERGDDVGAAQVPDDGDVQERGERGAEGARHCGVGRAADGTAAWGRGRRGPRLRALPDNADAAAAVDEAAREKQPDEPGASGDERLH